MVLVCPVHPAKTLEKLNQQRLSSSFTDVTVLVAGQQFTVHKCLLASYSSVFCSVFQDASLSQTTPDIKLDGVESEYFSIIIDFIYTSELKVTPTNVDQLHATAHFLQMPEVIDLCNKFKSQKQEPVQENPLCLVRSEVTEDTLQSNMTEADDQPMSSAILHEPVPLQRTPGQQVLEEKNEDDSMRLFRMTAGVMATNNAALPDAGASTKHSRKLPKRILSQEEAEQVKKQKKRGRKPQERVTCAVCDKVMTRRKYELHKHIHTGEKPYKCTMCDKQFVTIYNQKIHERIHTGERPYHCDICRRTFSDPSTTRKHKLWHAGVKNKKCGMCGKYFASLTQVREHMRTHTKEKPYVCTECGKAYGYRCDLKRHMREHTGDLIGPCHFCGKYFNHRGNYHSHLRLHNRKKEAEPQLRLQNSGLVTPDGRIILKAKLCDDPGSVSSTMMMVPAGGIPGDRGEVEIQDGDGHDGDQEVLKVHDFSQTVSDGEIEVTINNGKFYVKHSSNGQEGTILDGSRIIIQDDVSVTSASSSSQSQNQLFEQHVGTALSADQVLMLVQAQDLGIASSSMQETKDNISEDDDEILLSSGDNGKSVVIVDSDIP